MKKIILAVILMAAAGGTTYYLLQKKKQTIINDIDQQKIIGKWKMDSIAAKTDSSAFMIALIGTLDSNLLNYDYDFRKEGIVVQLSKDSMGKDTAHYEWTKDNHLIWKDSGDTTGESLIVNLLTKDSLVLRSKDSTVFYFKKTK